MPDAYDRSPHYNSGDEVALADDAAGKSNWQGRTADRCHPLSPLGVLLLFKASNAVFGTSRLWHAPDGRPPAMPGTSRHANYKIPRCPRA